MRENTAERWGSVQIALHWTIAALVLVVQVPGQVAQVQSRGSRAHLICEVLSFL